MAGELAFDVLIVGAGPTGVTLASLLARQGVSTLVIDKEADIYPLPRAAHIDHEVVRIFQELGAADEIMATSRSSPRYDFLTAKGEILLRFEGLDRQAAGGWPAGNMIHQPLLETALRGALAKQSAVSLKTRWSFAAFAEHDGRVLTEIDTPEGRVAVSSRYLVGADGARSPVRTAAGIEFDDLNFDEPWLVIDTIVHDRTRLPDANLQICDPARPTTCVLMGAGRHRWEFMIKPDETPEQVLDDAFIANLLRPWNVEGAVTLERKVVYRFNAKVAKAWRKGPVLLAGDSAHQMPPFAGQGLCSGVRDGANIAWKLAAVLRAGASEALLDSYQVEREPNVRTIIATAIMMGRTVCITDPEAAAQRDSQMLAARAANAAPSAAPGNQPMAEGCLFKGASGAGSYFPQPTAPGAPAQRLDDVLGPGAWLIRRSAAPLGRQDEDPTKPGVALKTIALDDTSLAPFRADLDLWLSKHGAHAVLVRPDRYVFGAGEGQTLYDAWARRLS